MLLDNIKKLCSQKRISLSQLESDVKLGKKTVFRWNEVSPSVDKLKRVADYFGVTVDELLVNTGEN